MEALTGLRLTERDARGKLRVSPVGFGCGPNAGLMVTAGEDERREVVAAAIACGIDFFDTAAAYGDGTSERNLGAVLADLGAPARVFTKVLVTEDDLDDVRLAVLRSLEASSERTGLVRFAGVTLHNRLVAGGEPRRIGIGPALTVAQVLGPGGVLEALEELREAGTTVGAFGFTTLGGDHAAIEAAIGSGRFDYVNAIHGILGPLDRGMPPIAGAPERYDVVRSAAAAGLDVIALRVLGGGLLLDPGPEQRAAVDALGAWSRRRGITLTRLALRFALSDPDVAALVVGFTERRHVEEAVAAVRNGPLAAEEIAELVRVRDGARDRAATQAADRKETAC